MESVDHDVRLSVGIDTTSAVNSMKKLMVVISKAFGEELPKDFDKTFENIQKRIDSIRETVLKHPELVDQTDEVGKEVKETVKEAAQAETELAGKVNEAREKVKETVNEAAQTQTELVNQVNEAGEKVKETIKEVAQVEAELAKSTNAASESLKQIGNQLKETEENMVSFADGAKMAWEHVKDVFIGLTEITEKSYKTVQEAFEEVDIPDDEISSKLQKLQNDVEKYSEKLELAKLKLQEFENQPPKPTSAYNSLTKELDKVGEEILKVTNQKKAFKEDYGLGAEQLSGYKELNNQLSLLIPKYERLKKKREEMEQSGTAFAADDVKRRTLQNSLASAERDYELAKAKLKEYRIEQQKLAESSEDVEEAVEEVAQASDRAAAKVKKSGRGFSVLLEPAIKNINRGNQYIKRMLSSLLRLGKRGSDSVKKVNGAAQNGIRTFMKYALSIGGLFAVLKKLQTTIAKSYKNLAQYSDEVNNSVSSVLSAFTKLENSLAAAVQPIERVVSPILSALIDKLSQAALAAGQFFAAITGQDFVYKAVDTQEDYAGSLKDTAESAEEAKKALKDYLSPLDEINRYTASDKSENKDSGVDKTPAFEVTPIEQKFKEIADKFHKMLDDISSLVKSHDWKGLGEYIANMLNKGLSKIKAFISWDNLGDKITETVKAITDTINSFVDNVDWKLLGETIGEGVNTLVNTAALFIEGINWANIGVAIADSLNGIFETVNWEKLGETLAKGMLILPTILVNFIQKLDTVKVGNALSEFINSFVKQFKLFVEDIDWKDIGTSIGKGIDEFLNNVNWDDIFTTIGDFVKGAFDLGTAIVEGIDWVQIGNDLTEGLKKVDWESVWNSLTGFLGSSFIGLSKFFGGIGAALFGIDPADYERDFDKGLEAIGDWWENYKRDFGAGVDTIKKAWDDMWKWLNTSTDEQGNEIYVDPSEWIVPNESFFDNYIRDFQAGWKAIGDFITPDFEIDPQITSFFENYVNDFQTGIDTIGKWFTEDIPGFFSNCWTSITGFFEGIPQWFTDTFNGAKEGIESAWEGVGEWFGGVWENISGFFSGAGEWFSGVFDGAKEGVENAWKGVAGWFGGVWDNIKDVFNNVGTWFKTIFQNAWRYIKKAWDGVGNWFSDVWKNIKGAFDGAVQWFSDLFNNIWNAIKAPFETVGKFFGDVWENIKSAFGGESGGTVTASATGFNYGSFSRTIAPLAADIPKLAQGAVIPPNREFLAVLGDQKRGRNFEAPESTLRQLIREELGSFGNSGGGSYQFTANLDGRVLFDKIIERAKLKQTLTGKNPFELG